MNLIEDRIRAAARAAAETVAPDSVPPLELPAARPRRFGRRPRGARSPGATWTPWVARLTPVAAALAVIAIVITVVTVSHPPHQGPDLVTGAAARPDVPLGPPVSTYVRSGQVPPYFVTLTPSGAAVHLTVSGAAVATIRPSLPGGKVVAVTAAGDDRTFVLAEQGQDRKAVTFYQFRLGSSGRPGALTRLPMSVADGKTMAGLALSPDGTRLAIAVAPGWRRPAGQAVPGSRRPGPHLVRHGRHHRRPLHEQVAVLVRQPAHAGVQLVGRPDGERPAARYSAAAAAACWPPAIRR